jgi:hypothetical protein
MAISFVSADSVYGDGSTLTMPTHQSGDLILLMAARRSNTLPSEETGENWTAITTAQTGSTMSARFAYKVAASGSENVGTWTNAEMVIVAVYRGQHASDPLGGSLASTATASNQMSYGGITMDVTDGTSWVMAFGIHRTATTTGGQAPPTGMSNREDSGAVAPRTGAHDTNAGVTEWTTQVVTASASSDIITFVQEIKADAGAEYDPGDEVSLGSFNQVIFRRAWR